MVQESAQVVDDVAAGVARTVASVATALNSRVQELSRDVREAIVGGIPEIRGDERLLEALAASVEANVVTFLHVLQGAASLDEAEAPAAALGYARRLAQRGISQDALIRTYRVGHARFLRWCFRELDTHRGNTHVCSATQTIVDQSFQYIDSVALQVALAYEAERDRWSRNRAAAQRGRVRALLNGDRVDLAATERLLDYRFAQRHVAMVVWCPRSNGAQCLLELEQAIDRIGARLPSNAATPLFVPFDDMCAWAWFPLPDGMGQKSIIDSIADLETPIRVALGDEGVGVDGFRQTHREALRAQSIALTAGDHAPRVTRFSEIAPIATLSSDIEFTRAWVGTTLGELASADAATERLRETALVFLRNGASYTAAADLLNIHKNTVHYRIQKVEEILERPLRDSPIDLQLALLACHWMREAVLSGS